MPVSASCGGRTVDGNPPVTGWNYSVRTSTVWASEVERLEDALLATAESNVSALSRCAFARL